MFGLHMVSLTDRVIEVPSDIIKRIQPLYVIAHRLEHFEAKVALLEDWLLAVRKESRSEDPGRGQKATQDIITTHGSLPIETICYKAALSVRSLERYFHSCIGLTPKKFSRIIRFSHIFKLAQKKPVDWVEIAYLAGFYNQSHFIKNFKEFTGEEPSNYGFNTRNMANLFLR